MPWDAILVSTVKHEEIPTNGEVAPLLNSGLFDTFRDSLGGDIVPTVANPVVAEPLTPSLLFTWLTAISFAV